jgi:hypothetical protein
MDYRSGIQMMMIVKRQEGMEFRANYDLRSN